MRRDGQSYFYHTDVLGSVAALTDDHGQVAATYDYDAFGALTGGHHAVSNPFTFTAREWEPGIALYYYRSRYYDPSLGRFLTPDPVLADPLNPLSFNPYAYVLNNPLRYIDPLGAAPGDSGFAAMDPFEGELPHVTMPDSR